MNIKIILILVFGVIMLLTSCVSADNCKKHKTENEINEEIIKLIKDIKTIKSKKIDNNAYALHLSNDTMNFFDSRLQKASSMKMAIHTIEAITSVVASSITGISTSENVELASAFSGISITSQVFRRVCNSNKREMFYLEGINMVRRAVSKYYMGVANNNGIVDDSVSLLEAAILIVELKKALDEVKSNEDKIEKLSFGLSESTNRSNIIDKVFVSMLKHDTRYIHGKLTNVTNQKDITVSQVIGETDTIQIDSGSIDGVSRFRMTNAIGEENEVVVKVGNRKPVAKIELEKPIAKEKIVENVNGNYQINVHDIVIINGINSKDEEGGLEGDLLTYSWSLKFPAGRNNNKSEAMLSDCTSVNPVFVTNSPGSYQVTLTVNDGTFSAKKAVIIDVVP